MLTLAVACDWVLTPFDSPYTDVLEIVYLFTSFSPTFDLCLANSTSDLAFSLEASSDPIDSNITIQYLLHRSKCLSYPCTLQTLWVRSHFTYQVLGTLTFLNVRITGKRLIWEECTEEWCTHCLTPPFIWPGREDFTVIDHHPAADPSDPYYQASLCQDVNFVFFDLTNSLMVIENCTLDTIRIRASHFIRLQQASLIITNTNITDMDFTGFFIDGTAQNVHLSSIYVAGFNRDHAYVWDYSSDSGFIRLFVTNITLSSSLFEDNVQLLAQYTDIYFIDISNYLYAKIDACIFRSSMHSFAFSVSEISYFSSLIIQKSRFEGDLSLPSLPYLLIVSLWPGEVHIVDTAFTNITARSNALLIFQMSDFSNVVEISRTTFTNNHAYMSEMTGVVMYLYTLLVEAVTIEDSTFEVTGEAQSLVSTLISKGLINNSSDVYTDLVMRPTTSYVAVLYFETWDNILLQNVSFTDNTVSETLMYFSNTIHTVLQLDVKHLLARTAGGMRVGSNRNVSLYGRISNSIFEATWGTAIVFNDTSGPNIELIVTDCEFTGSGIAFAGTKLHVLNSLFANISSDFGALDVKVIDMNEAVPTMILFIRNSSFISNQGQQLGADVDIRSACLFTSLNLNIRDSNFVQFSGTSGGSIYIELQLFTAAVIESCRFSEGVVSFERGVTMTTHAKGTLNLANVLFDFIYIPNSYLIQVTSPSIPSLDMQTLTNLTRVIIRNCTYQAAVSLKGKYWMTWLRSYQCHFAGNMGVAVRSELGVWEDVESILEHNTAEDYPCYFQVEHSVGDFVGTQFLYNAANSGSCIYLRGQDSTGVFTRCLFRGNTANFSGGVMRIEQSPIIKIASSRFIANAAPKASVLQLINARNPVSVMDSELQENQGNGVIVLSMSSLTLNRSSLLINSDAKTAGVVLIRSSFLAEQVSFLMQTGLRGCLFYAQSSSSVKLTSCQVTQITCDENIFDVTSNSTLAISQSIFKDLISTKQSVIWVEDGLLQTVYLSVEHVSTGQAFLSTIRSSVSIKSSVWRGLRGRGIQADTGEVFALVDSEIRDVRAGDSVLQWIDFQKVQLARVSVSNVTGGLQLQAVRVQVEGCVFRQVRGNEVGALWVESSELKVMDSIFLHNSALATNSISAALRFSTNNSLISNCTFAFNTAQSGAAIFYPFTSPKLLNTTFAANQALYGPDTASFPTKLCLFNHSTVVVVSGQPFASSIVVGVLDGRNQLVRTYTNNQAWLVGKGLSGKLQASAKGDCSAFLTSQ